MCERVTVVIVCVCLGRNKRERERVGSDPMSIADTDSHHQGGSILTGHSKP